MPKTPSRKSRNTKRTLLSLALIVLSLPTITEAKVFRRWSTRGATASAFEALGGTKAYESKMEVNGESANVMVYSLPESLAINIPTLARSFDADEVTYNGGSLGQVIAKKSKHVLQLIALDISQTAPKTLVIAISQERKAFDDSRQADPQAGIDDLPAYPQANCLFHGSNADTKTQLATLRTLDDPETAKTFYINALEADGWKAALPSTKGTMPSMLFYLKGNEICLMAASAKQANSTDTIITLLHEQLEVSKQGSL
jgi:hypothetical protein